MTRAKICGITRLDDALLCAEAGADAIGLNFWPGTPRCVDVETARQIVDAVGDRTLTVGVFVDATEAEIRAVKERTGVRCVQLHGDEPPELIEALLPHAYKALRISDAQSVERARAYPGEHILLDAYVAGQPGGTGHTFNWQLAAELARKRHVTLAGGLHPGNVAQAVAAVAPFCVDVASGVERAPGIKDPSAVRAFIDAVRRVSGLQSPAGSPIAERPASRRPS